MVKTNLYRKIQNKDDALEFVKELAQNSEFDKNADNEEGHRIIKLLNDCAIFGVKLEDEKKVLTTEEIIKTLLLNPDGSVAKKLILFIREYGEQQRTEGYEKGLRDGEGR